MEKDLARHVLRVSYRSAGALGDLVPMLKTELAESEYKSLAVGLASAMAEIDQKVNRLIYSLHPELEEEIDDQIERLGRVL